MLKYAINQASAMNWSFDRSVNYFASLGATAIVIQRPRLEAYGVNNGVSLLRQQGLTVAALLSTGMFTLDEHKRWPEQEAKAKEHLEMAAQVGAKHLLLISGGCGRLSYEEAEERFLDVLSRLLPRAEQLGVAFTLEPNKCLRSDLGYIHTFHDALDLAQLVASPFLSVCFETNNSWIERRLYRNITEGVSWVGLVQINDFKEGTTCTPSRVPLGDGIIPLERILSAFEEAGYDGFYDIEQLGPDIEEMGYEEAVGRSVRWIEAFHPQSQTHV